MSTTFSCPSSCLCLLRSTSSCFSCCSFSRAADKGDNCSFASWLGKIGEEKGQHGIFKKHRLFLIIGRNKLTTLHKLLCRAYNLQMLLHQPLTRSSLHKEKSITCTLMSLVNICISVVNSTHCSSSCCRFCIALLS